jgi:signal peptidase I
MQTNYQAAAVLFLLEQKEPFVVKISGHCMEPSLGFLDVVEVAPARHYFPGDVLVFNDKLLGLTAHRLLGVTVTTRGLRYMTKADNSLVIDRLREPATILGKVVKNRTKNTCLRPQIAKRLACFCEMSISSIKIVLNKYFKLKYRF